MYMFHCVVKKVRHLYNTHNLCMNIIFGLCKCWYMCILVVHVYSYCCISYMTKIHHKFLRVYKTKSD